MSIASSSVSIVDSIISLIEKEAGLTFPDHRRGEVEEAIRRAADAARAESMSDYLRLIRGDAGLREDLAAAVTIGESYFMRDPVQLALIRDVLLAELRTAHGADLRIWSAGCSSGEEPYTLAIVLAEMGARLEWPIIATDINRIALRRAEAGVYGEWSFRGVDPELRARHFIAEGKRFRIRDEIRTRVRFDSLNLATPDYPSLWSGISGMHLIVCRNVLIYLSPRAIGSVTERLHASLANDGWLVLGASDPPLDQYAPFETRILEGRVAYRRRSAPTTISTISALRPVAAPPAVPDRRRSSRVRPPRPDAEVQTDDVARIRALADAGRHHEAADLAALARRRAPLDAELHYLAAAISLERGENIQAAAIARRALYLDPGLAVAAIVLGSALRRSGDLPSARAAYRAAAATLARVPADQGVPLGDGECAGSLLRTVNALIAMVGEQ